jgi:hypothetical protein
MNPINGTERRAPSCFRASAPVVNQTPQIAESGGTNQGNIAKLRHPRLDSTIEYRNSRIDTLPDEQQKLVRSILSNKDNSELYESLRALVCLGGMESAKAIAILLSEVTTDKGALAQLSLGGRHVTVYSLTKAMLKIAEDNRLGGYESIVATRRLAKAEKREIWDFVKSLARGDHGDVEVATGVRGLLFERFCNLPVVGGRLHVLLNIAGRIDGTPSGAPPRLLFVLFDLPWILRSKIPFASTESRKGNLAELLYRST